MISKLIRQVTMGYKRPRVQTTHHHVVESNPRLSDVDSIDTLMDEEEPIIEEVKVDNQLNLLVTDNDDLKLTTRRPTLKNEFGLAIINKVVKVLPEE